jgi:hypothetical protein
MRAVLNLRIALTLLLAIVFALPLAAAELAGVELADSAVVGDATLTLNGLGLRKKAIFKVYVGGLYLPAKESDPDKILAADAPRQVTMEIVYKKVTADQLCEGWTEGLAGNSPSSSSKVQGDFKKLCDYMADVVKGERLTYTYKPSQGTEIAVKGEVKGTIEGKDFADALFRCWLGPEPPSAAFKEGMLGLD